MPLNFNAAAVVMAGFVLVILIALSRQDLSLLKALAVAPLAVLLVSRPDLWLAFVVALWQSMLKIPQAPANLSAFHIFSLGLVVLLIPYRMLRRVSHRASPVRKYAWLFGLILVVTAALRGAGIRVLGSPLWGGAPYVTLLITIALFLTADFVDVSSKVWRNALIAMCLMSIFPMAAQMLYVLSGGSIYQQYAFVQPVGQIASTLEAVDSGVGVARFNVSMGVTFVYLPFIFFEYPYRRNVAWVTLLLILVSLVSCGLSGFRSSLLATILFVAICSALESKGTNWKRGFRLVGCVAVLLTVAALFAQHLPTSIQRSLSFIPFSNISSEARIDAASTTVWRLGVWKRAIQDIPQYLLLGQGFAFSPRRLMELMATGTYVREWAFVTHSYHNGLLSLILVFGLPGLLVGMGFILSGLREYSRLMRGSWSDPLLHRLFRLVFAQFLTQCLVFGTIYGDVQVSFPVFFFQAMLLEGLAKTQQNLATVPAAAPSSPTMRAGNARAPAGSDGSIDA